VNYGKTSVPVPQNEENKRACKTRPVRADESMTVPTLALYLHCHTGTVYRLLKQRK
jgi:hypothetical protein